MSRAAEETLEALAIEWTFYESRFGIAAEIHNGRWSDEQLIGVARGVLALLNEVRALRALVKTQARQLAQPQEVDDAGELD